MKCEKCCYYGRPSDAPETVEEMCMYMPEEDDVDEEGNTIDAPPCMWGREGGEDKSLREDEEGRGK